MIILCGTCNEEIPLDHASMHGIDKDGSFKSYHFGCGIPKPVLQQSKELDLINTIHVIEFSASGGELEYVYVKNSESNIAKLISLGARESEIKEFTSDDGDCIDLYFMFPLVKAQWFQNNLGGFLNYVPEDDFA